MSAGQKSRHIKKSIFKDLRIDIRHCPTLSDFVNVGWFLYQTIEWKFVLEVQRCHSWLQTWLSSRDPAYRLQGTCLK